MEIREMGGAMEIREMGGTMEMRQHDTPWHFQNQPQSPLQGFNNIIYMPRMLLIFKDKCLSLGLFWGQALVYQSA